MRNSLFSTSNYSIFRHDWSLKLIRVFDYLDFKGINFNFFHGLSSLFIKTGNWGLSLVISFE